MACRNNKCYGTTCSKNSHLAILRHIHRKHRQQSIDMAYHNNRLGPFIIIRLLSMAVTQCNWMYKQGIKWRALWKKRISSTTMKLRKSLIKPVTQQNISSLLVLPPEIVMHDALNVNFWMSADILCIVVHDDLGWKNRTTHFNRFWRAGCSWLEHVDICLVC